ncbi:hypothetical protein AMATHDRAFT_6925 [Amanita thiersii Skay4041]|uniref:Uncharacterized protein n=1 Tax=Amanita thiersii Skay4041 TaxID=703135 RepID=A0A2A9NGA5_9AGAR|nr:hypothetical protein AMATHDRAFT_6925 [Amanita thiersii Skay4041]
MQPRRGGAHTPVIVPPPAVQEKAAKDTKNDIPTYPIRITNHGKIRVWVAFVLDFFEKNGDIPVLLHTLPTAYLSSLGPSARPPPSESESKQKPNTTSAGDTLDKTERTTKDKGKGKAMDVDEEGDEKQSGSAKECSLSTATTTIPRLISVVEIVKREFLKSLAAKKSPRLAGLYQYTEYGCLEDLKRDKDMRTSEKSGGIRAGDDRAREVLQALSGKHNVQQKQTPYMKITLSLGNIPGLVERGASYQSPTIRKISKSAKSRAKKREKKSQAAAGTSEEDDDMVTE